VRPRAFRLSVPRGQSGQGMPEYGLILALVGIAAIVGMTFMGGEINTLLSTLGNAL
jgi:Flp pilus assembly pilin Flp